MIEIIPSCSLHCLELSKTLREADKEEALGLGLDPKKSIFYAYRHAIYRKTALIRDEVSAMWGVVGVPMGNIGQPYLLTSHLVETVSPLRFAKIYINEVKEMKNLFPILENYVDASYYGAVRMLKISGFTFEESIFMNNKEYIKFRMTS